MRRKVSLDGQGHTAVVKDFFNDINEGLRNIFKSNMYKDYAGWVFIDLKYDENGIISNKYVRLFNENIGFKNEILKMLERLNHQSPAIADGQKTSFEKFYIVLVESNEVVIPEEALKKQRSIPLR
jgi:hypothetical protein